MDAHCFHHTKYAVGQESKSCQHKIWKKADTKVAALVHITVIGDKTVLSAKMYY
jgi:hypothetical protein